MSSEIAENASEMLGTIPRVEVFESTDSPKTIATPATDTAPRGHIIDDSARGTLFWEAELSDDDEVAEELEPSEIEEQEQEHKHEHEQDQGQGQDQRQELDQDQDQWDATAAASGNTATASSTTSTEPQQTWGNPFKIEWMSSTRVPFYRTRGLRNPWNGNKEIKVARDGTEVEPDVGRRLVQLFHRPDPPALPPVLPN